MPSSTHLEHTVTRSLKCITPVDGSVYVERPLASPDEAIAALSRARAAQQAWRQISVGDRQALLTRAVDAFVADGGDIAQESSWQMGRPVRFGGSEVDGLAERARYMIAAAEEALADIEAGGIHGLYGYLDFLAKQLFPDTAESEYLRRWARIWRVTPAEATAATGEVTFAGNNGVAIPQGTRLQASDGAEYRTDEAVSIASGTATVSVTAQASGEAGDLAAGTELQLVSSLAGVEGAATVAAAALSSWRRFVEVGVARMVCLLMG